MREGLKTLGLIVNILVVPGTCEGGIEDPGSCSRTN